MAIFIPAGLRLPGSETPHLGDLEIADLPVGVAYLDPGAGLGLREIQRDALLRLEYQSGLLVWRLPHVGEGRRDHHGALVGERLLLHPGEVPGLIAHLD